MYHLTIWCLLIQISAWKSLTCRACQLWRKVHALSSTERLSSSVTRSIRKISYSCTLRQEKENFAYWAQLPFWNQYKPLRKPLTLRTTVPLTEIGKRFTWSWVTDSSEQFDFGPEGPGECSLNTYKRLHSSHTNLFKDPTPWLEPARHLKIGAPNNCLRNLIMRVFWNPTWTHRAWRA